MAGTSEETQKVAALLKGKRIAMLTTTDVDGTFASRPMALQEVEFDGDLWFFTDRDSTAVAQIHHRPAVNVTVADSSEWVSLNGTASVVEDPAKKQELWNTVVGAWFPDGPDADHIVLLKVEAESAEYWDTPGGRLASAFSFAKAKATGKPYSGGENEKVEL
jgi:general stress protein 26